MFRILVALPFLLLLVLFALSNTRTVPLGLWPTDLRFELPLALAILVAAGIAFLLGAMVLWVSAVAARLRARRAENGMRVLESRVAELQAELARMAAGQRHAGDAVPALPTPALESSAPQLWRG